MNYIKSIQASNKRFAKAIARFRPSLTGIVYASGRYYMQLLGADIMDLEKQELARSRRYDQIKWDMEDTE